MDPLSGDQRETPAEVKAHLAPENAGGSGSSAVRFVRAGSQDIAQEVFIRRWDAHGSSLLWLPPPAAQPHLVVKRLELLHGNNPVFSARSHMAHHQFAGGQVWFVRRQEG